MIDVSCLVDFWKCSPQRNDRKLRIIAIPYKEGEHFPKQPSDFKAVIKQLQLLHDHGYVHGDIRAFNVVFCGTDSGLIDFDFSGQPGKAYPNGYRGKLTDGHRIGTPTAKLDKHSKLQYWHDWYALGQLIFSVFHLTRPANDQYAKSEYDGARRDFDDLRYEWIELLSDVENKNNEMPKDFDSMINELLSILDQLTALNWILKPVSDFAIDLDAVANKNNATTTPLQKGDGQTIFPDPPT